MAGTDNIASINLLELAQGYQHELERDPRKDIGMIGRNLDVIKDALEDAQGIIKKYGHDFSKLEEELEDEFGKFGLQVDAKALANPEQAIMDMIQSRGFSRYHRIEPVNGVYALNFKGADSLDDVITNIQAQQDLADQFSGWGRTDVHNMAKFLADSADRIAKNPELANSPLGGIDNLQQTITDMKTAPLDISVADMSALWAKGPETIALLARINTTSDSDAVLELANKAYGMKAGDIQQYAEVIAAQDELAAKHFGGDKVKMAEFFVQNPLDGPIMKAPFDEFVSSEAASFFITETLSITAKYNAASGADIVAEPTMDLEHIQQLITDFKDSLSEETQNGFVSPLTEVLPAPEGATSADLDPQQVFNDQYHDFLLTLTPEEREQLQGILDKASKAGIDFHEIPPSISDQPAPEPEDSTPTPSPDAADDISESPEVQDTLNKLAAQSAAKVDDLDHTQALPPGDDPRVTITDIGGDTPTEQIAADISDDTAPIIRDPSSDALVIVQPGDSLSVMIQDQYGLTKYSEILELMPSIMALNPQIKDAGQIGKGDTITMPTKDQIYAMRDGDIDTQYAHSTSSPAQENAPAPG